MATSVNFFPAAGTIDYEEFLAATVNLNYLEKEDTMFKAFSYFDKDASGFITREELEDALQVGLRFSIYVSMRQLTLLWTAISHVNYRDWWQCLS